MKKAKLLLFVIPLILATMGFVSYVASNDEFEQSRPTLPIESEPNQLLITSNGCCFWVEDVRVLLQDDRGNQVEVSSNQKVSGHDIFKYQIPDFSSTPFTLIVKFRVLYGEESDFSLPVMKFENINILNDTGILLYFQEYDDVYLNVIAGDYHASHKMGNEENSWNITDTPNKIYN